MELKYIGIIYQLYVPQNKLLKVLFNIHYRYHTNNLYRVLELLKSKDVFNSLLLQFVHRTVRNNCPEPFKVYFKRRETVHGFDTRNKNDLVKHILRQIMENEQSITKGLPYGINLKVKSKRPLTKFLRKTLCKNWCLPILPNNEESPNKTIHYWTFAFVPW